MNIRNEKIGQVVDYSAIRSVSKFALIGIWLVLILYLVTLLPGMDWIVPETSFTIVAVISAIVSITMVGALIIIASKLAELVEISLDGPEAIIEDISSVIYWGVILGAILVAHRGLSGIIAPLLDDSMWLYDMTFLLIALPVVVFIAIRLYVLVDPSSEVIADRIGLEQDARENTASEEG